ncbi:MAG: hypothetical protein M1409_05685 [Actinobacteria bacterium]|nr:hypothetical protein [Actinomycetota bacterium]
MEKADFLIEKLQGQIEEMDEKVASLICDLKEMDDKKKEGCLKTANEIEKKISEMQQQVEDLKKKMAAPDFKPVDFRNM